MTLRDELPPTSRPDSIIGQSMILHTRDKEHRALAAEMKLWELENKVTIYPIGATSNDTPATRSDDRETANTKEKSVGKHNRMNGKSKSGHMNITELKTCYTYCLSGETVKTVKFGDDKAATLAGLIIFRNEHRKKLGLPPANY